MKVGQDSLKTQKTMTVDGQDYQYYSLKKVEKTIGNISKLPFSLKILLENLLRFEDGHSVDVEDIKALGQWLETKQSTKEIAYRPARVLMQDFTGVPAVVDLAAMRGAFQEMGGDPTAINPLVPVDLVIDHSVMVDKFGTKDAFKFNVKKEYQRNKERYEFLRWGQKAFNNFRVVPPGAGICHQVNLEYLAKGIWHTEVLDQEGDLKKFAYPDTLVGTDSHTTMVNALGVLGWGVGGIEAEAAMLGQPISMLIPKVVGFRLIGKLPEGTTATDLVLAVVQSLRIQGVVGKFVEFYGPGLETLSLADRATIANMAPEYGATCGIFPIDKETVRYLKFTGRPEHEVNLVEAYAKEQGMWRDENTVDPEFSETLSLDMATIQPSLAGPKRPQDKVFLSDMTDSADNSIVAEGSSVDKSAPVLGKDFDIHNGDVVIAAITSCTNTSNPSVMLGAGLVAQKALEKGLSVKPWVKTSLAPGSQVVTDYLKKAGLQESLDALGFDLVGYGCTTCIGNSGPLDEALTHAIKDNNLAVAGVLSGNRNFEGRIHPHVKLNYLASPMLVVAYALAGSLKIDISNESLGNDAYGNPVYLKDIWPTNAEIQEVVDRCVTSDMFRERYGKVFDGDAEWQALPAVSSLTYDWQDESTYVKSPTFFENITPQKSALQDIKNAHILALLGDSITTDHISPAGAIKEKGPAGDYLKEHGVSLSDFNSFGSRRGNHEVMMRGTFANVRLSNEMRPDIKGGYTKHMPEGTNMSIFEAAMAYKKSKIPLVIFGGKEYGTGSSRDWAAKGTRLLGVQAVITESFERIHRSNLIGMGVLPLEFVNGETRKTLGLTGAEIVNLEGISEGLKPGKLISLSIQYPDGAIRKTKVKCRLDTVDEVEYFENDGILHYVLRRMKSDDNGGDQNVA